MDFKQTDECGDEYFPILENYENVVFNPYVKDQIQSIKTINAADVEESDDDVQVNDDQDRIQKMKEDNKYKVTSKLRSKNNFDFNDYLCCFVIWDIIHVVIFLALPLALIPVWGAGTITMFVFCGIIGLLKVYFNPISKQLDHIMDGANSNIFINNLRGKRPQPRFGIICYNDKDETPTTTFMKFKQFKCKYWADWSPEIKKAIQKYPVTAINVKVKVIYYDDYTLLKYKKQVSNLESSYKNRDDSYRMLENCHIDELVGNFITTNENGSVPWFCNYFVQFVISFLFSSLQMWMFWYNIACIDQVLVKVLSKRSKIVMGQDVSKELNSSLGSGETVDDIGNRVEMI